jgi:hypothetical protein
MAGLSRPSRLVTYGARLIGITGTRPVMTSRKGPVRLRQRRHHLAKSAPFDRPGEGGMIALARGGTVPVARSNERTIRI